MIIIAEFQQPTCFFGVSPAKQSITSRFPPFGIHPSTRRKALFGDAKGLPRIFPA